jgi:hypothetical protein
MVRSRKIRTELEQKVRDALRAKDMDTGEIWRSVDGSKRTVQMILSDWHDKGILFYHPETGKHTLRPTLAKPYMKDYRKYDKAMGLELKDLEKWGKWCASLEEKAKASKAYREFVGWQIAKTSVEMILTILTCEQQRDAKSREEHLDIMIDIYLRGRLQSLRMTGEWDSDVADQAFREVQDGYMKQSDEHRERFIKILGRPLRWRAARDRVSRCDRTATLHAAR